MREGDPNILANPKSAIFKTPFVSISKLFGCEVKNKKKKKKKNRKKKKRKTKSKKKKKEWKKEKKKEEKNA